MTTALKILTDKRVKTGHELMPGQNPAGSVLSANKLIIKELN